MTDSFPQYADVPFGHHVIMMDQQGHWSGVDARDLLADPEVVVAVIPRREQISHLEGGFTYIGTAHWRGDMYVVLRVPDARDRTLIALQFTTIPFGQLPRIHLPEDFHAPHRTQTPRQG